MTATRPITLSDDLSSIVDNFNLNPFPRTFLDNMAERFETFKVTLVESQARLDHGFIQLTVYAAKLQEKEDEFTKQMKEKEKTLAEAEKNLDKRELDLTILINQYEAEKLFVKKTNENLNDRIKLNVGGTLMETTRQVLQSVPGSMLQAFVSGRHNVATDADGRIFLDRDPAIFRYLLGTLRLGWPAHTLYQRKDDSFFVERSAILEEFDYFCIPPPLIVQATRDPVASPDKHPFGEVLPIPISFKNEGKLLYIGFIGASSMWYVTSSGHITVLNPFYPGAQTTIELKSYLSETDQRVFDRFTSVDAFPPMTRKNLFNKTRLLMLVARSGCIICQVTFSKESDGKVPKLSPTVLINMKFPMVSKTDLYMFLKEMNMIYGFFVANSMDLTKIDTYYHRKKNPDTVLTILKGKTITIEQRIHRQIPDEVIQMVYLDSYQNLLWFVTKTSAKCYPFSGASLRLTNTIDGYGKENSPFVNLSAMTVSQHGIITLLDSGTNLVHFYKIPQGWLSTIFIGATRFGGNAFHLAYSPEGALIVAIKSTDPSTHLSSSYFVILNQKL